MSDTTRERRFSKRTLPTAVVALLMLSLAAASGSQSSFRRSQWLSVADQPVALDIARGQQRSDGLSFLLVRGTSNKALAISEVVVKVSTTETLRSVARDAPAYGCSELQRTSRPGARGGPDSETDQDSETEQTVWRCDLGQNMMTRLLDGSASRLEFLLAAGDGLEQAVTVEIGWLRRRRLATLR